MMVNLHIFLLLHFLLLLNHFLHIPALNTFTGRSAFFSRTVAIAIIFHTVTFRAFTFRYDTSVTPGQKQSIPVLACNTLAVWRASKAIFKALTVIFPTSSFGTETSPNSWVSVSASRSGGIWYFEFSRFRVLKVDGECGCRLVVIIEWLFFVIGGFGNKLLKEILILFVVLETINHDHNLFLFINVFVLLDVHRLMI